jgi:hypothetical protein
MAGLPPVPGARVFGPPAHVTNRTMTQATRAGQMALLEYAMGVLLQAEREDALVLSIDRLGYVEFADLLAMTVEDIDGMTYIDPIDPTNRVPTPVPRGYTQRVKILVSMYLKWSYIRGTDIDLETVTLEDFYRYRTSEYNPANPFGVTHRAAHGMAPVDPAAVAIAPVVRPVRSTPAQLFDRGIKRDKDHYPESMELPLC